MDLQDIRGLKIEYSKSLLKPTTGRHDDDYPKSSFKSPINLVCDRIRYRYRGIRYLFVRVNLI